MTRVLTYGTFDLFHEGHYRLLARAAALGDHLIVGVTSEGYDSRRGKLNVTQPLAERIENVQRSGLADQILVEEREGQKIEDIQRYGVDIFVIGSDWEGQFDYLREYCDVQYLERTSGISSTLLRQERGIVRMGVIGAGRIAHRFVAESKFVSGVTIEGCYTPRLASAADFASVHQLEFAETDYDAFLDRVDAVYVASPHLAHHEQARIALERGCHVLCEKPAGLDADAVRSLYRFAQEQGLVFLEAVKTAYAPGFVGLVTIAKSGAIGAIRGVDATFTKLTTGRPRELQRAQGGGSLSELGSYPLLAVAKLLGTEPLSWQVQGVVEPDSSPVDLFSRVTFAYRNAFASATVGLGAKAEGSLVVAGTEGYIYAPAPWWKTDYFEIRREDPRSNERHSYPFAGDGLRYELNEFIRLIGRGQTMTHLLTVRESAFIAGVLGEARARLGLVDDAGLVTPSTRSE